MGPSCRKIGSKIGTPSFDLEFDLEDDLEIKNEGHIRDQRPRIDPYTRFLGILNPSLNRR